MGVTNRQACENISLPQHVVTGVLETHYSMESHHAETQTWAVPGFVDTEIGTSCLRKCLPSKRQAYPREFKLESVRLLQLGEKLAAEAKTDKGRGNMSFFSDPKHLLIALENLDPSWNTQWPP